MPHEIGFVDDTTQLAHYAMLEKIHDFADANGYTILRYDTSADNHELIMLSTGLSGTDEIYTGFRTYQSAGSDYYNLVAACFTGYVPENSFESQPGATLSGVPCHNQRVDYWLTLNANRIALAMKVGTPVYEHCYVGKFLPFASPSQYPYPVCCAGMLNGTPATRFSDTAHSMAYKGGSNLRARFVSGAWLTCDSWPYIAGFSLRDTGGVYPLLPITLRTATDVLGELDGIAYISGFNNVVENTTTVDGVTWVVMQDTYRTGIRDYYAIRMDT